MMYPPKSASPEGIAPSRAGRGTSRSANTRGSYTSRGSMAAFITYAKALDSTERDSAEHAALVDRIRDLKPALRAVGLFDVMTVRDPEVAAILGM